jgi:hypothetical protein
MSAEKARDHRKALKLLQHLYSECPCAQFKLDIERNIESIYGVKGSDCTVSIWDSVPLMTQTEPTHNQDYAWTQVGRKIYRHGGVDKSSDLDQGEELWMLNIDSRIWTLLRTGGKHPGCRYGHTMWSWRNSLYVWGGGLSRWSKSRDTKLYRLDLSKSDLVWEMVKTKASPPGREYHAGVVYKDKYYISGGDYDSHITKECWVLNMTNFKWTKLKDAPTERQQHGMWAAHDKLYILGGRRVYSDLIMTRLQDAYYTVEEFVSYDIKTKEWSEEPVIGDRPFDVSEFTVLPIYDNPGDDDASSIIIWGGYHEFDSVNGPTKAGRNPTTFQLLYGDEWTELKSNYLSRMLRFYTETKVFQKINPTTEVLPKAQSFGAAIKATENSLQLLVGGGYGFTAGSMRDSHQYKGKDLLTPLSSNEGESRST